MAMAQHYSNYGGIIVLHSVYNIPDTPFLGLHLIGYKASTHQNSTVYYYIPEDDSF